MGQLHLKHSDITVGPSFNEISVRSTWSVPSNDVIMSTIVTLSDAELDYYAAFDNAGDVPMGKRLSPSQCAQARYV